LDVPVALRIVGGDNATLRRKLQRAGLDGAVAWAGRVPHEQCYAIAAESDLLLMTSRKEPFGMVTIETMSMGCVPIAYDVPSGSTEIIEHDKSGLLIPLGDIRAWAGQIRDLHHNRQRLAGLSAGAMHRARTSFNAETMARNMTAFLSDVMGHAETHLARRETGLPPETPLVYARPRRGYQLLPAGMREWIRNTVCASPRLSHWWLNR
jgi:glycosyltransferase involved in cell wall biosynthesis